MLKSLDTIASKSMMWNIETAMMVINLLTKSYYYQR